MKNEHAGLMGRALGRKVDSAARCEGGRGGCVSQPLLLFHHPPPFLSFSLSPLQLCDLVPPPPPGSTTAAPSSRTGPGQDGGSDGNTPRALLHPAPGGSAGASQGRNGIERPKHAILADTIAELKDLRQR